MKKQGKEKNPHFKNVIFLIGKQNYSQKQSKKQKQRFYSTIFNSYWIKLKHLRKI